MPQLFPPCRLHFNVSGIRSRDGDPAIRLGEKFLRVEF
jgi:hypothetical protein